MIDGNIYLTPFNEHSDEEDRSTPMVYNTPVRYRERDKSKERMKNNETVDYHSRI